MTPKKEIETLIEYLVEQELKEQNVPKRRLAQNYAKAIKRKDPELHDLLLRQAIFAIKSVKKDEKPRDNIDVVQKLLRLDPEADPRNAADTHGVRLFIDALLDSPKLAGRSKRWYQQAIDGVIRDTYGEK